MNFLFSNGYPNQVLVIHKLKKKGISAAFAMKHCFLTKPIPMGKGLSAIQTCHWHYAVKLQDFPCNLATNYQPYNASHDIKPSLSPQKLPETEVDNTVCTASSHQIQQKQCEADRYIKEHLQTRNRFQQFCNNPHLSAICLDCKLDYRA